MLIELFMSEEKVISQRAGYPLSAIGEYYPQRLSPYLAKLIYYARTPINMTLSIEVLPEY